MIPLPKISKAAQLQYLENIFHHAAAGIVLVDARTNIMEMVNPAYAKMHGYHVKELKGHSGEKLMSPECRPQMEALIKQIHTEGHSSFELVNKKKDGTLFPVSVDVTAVKDENGEVVQRIVSVLDITEQKNAQKSARESERKYRELFNLASDAIFIADQDGKYIDVNSAACDMMGYSKTELVGKSITDLLSEKDIPRLWAAKEMLADPKKTESAEWVLKKKDGTLLTVELNAQILPDTRWIAIARDVTERKALQQELLASEKKFRDILQEFVDGIAVINSKGIIEFTNKQFQKCFGYKDEELVGQEIEMVVPERYREEHLRQRAVYAAHPKVRSMAAGFNLMGRQKDGTDFPVDVSLIPFYTKKGLSVAVSVKDLSDRSRYAARQRFLAESSRILAETRDFNEQIHKLAELIVPFLSDFSVVYMYEDNNLLPKASCHRNADMAKSLSQLAGDLFSLPGILPDAIADVGSVKSVLVQPVSESYLRSVSKDDQHFELLQQLGLRSMLTIPLTIRRERIGVLLFGMNTSGRDFTPQDVEFAELVAMRMGMAVSNLLLFVQARKAIEGREKILAIVSHDLKNSLSIVQSSCSIVGRSFEEKKPLRLETFVPMVSKSVNQMSRLISDLLDFSQVQEGKLRMNFDTADINEILRDVAEIYHVRANEKSIALVVDHMEVNEQVECDDGRIMQVLSNLIGNAIKFTPKNGSIKVVTVASPDMIRFSVQDSGNGISPNALEKVFQMHWQARETAHLGSGLGLYIAKGIVDSHGGKIWAESLPNQGATFIFEIPKTQQDTFAKRHQLKNVT